MTNNDKEEWRDIPDMEGKYKASSMGRIKSNTRQGERILRLHKNTRGYLSFAVYIGGKKKTVRVHKCVSEAFLGKCPEGLIVNHKDSDTLNNAVKNLEFVSKRENMCHYLDTKKKLVAASLRKDGKYHSAIRVNKQRIYIGSYDTPEQANAAYIEYLNKNGLENRYATQN